MYVYMYEVGSMAGLKVDDVIMKVKNQVLSAEGAPVDTFISAVRTSKDTPLQLEVLRNNGSGSCMYVCMFVCTVCMYASM